MTKKQDNKSNEMLNYVEFYIVHSVTLERQFSARYIVSDKTRNRVHSFMQICLLLQDAKNITRSQSELNFLSGVDSLLEDFQEAWNRAEKHD